MTVGFPPVGSHFKEVSPLRPLMCTLKSVSSGTLASLLDREPHEAPVKGEKVSYASSPGASSFVAQLLYFLLDTSKARSPLLLGHHLCG